MLTQGGETPLVGTIVGHHTAVYGAELGAVNVLEQTQVLGCLLLEEFLCQRSQFVLYHIAFTVGHAAFGKVAKHFGQLLLAFGSGQRHEVVHGTLDEDVIVNLDIEIHGQIEVVGKGADNAVHEAVDGANGKIGIVVKHALQDSSGIALQGIAVEM